MKKNVKVSKAVTSLDVVNPDLKASFEAVVNLEAEISVYEKAVSMLNAGSISVRGSVDRLTASCAPSSSR